mmetsp:Transcript_30554/g.29460  ORF Transcript_30554/g.29460 Transcript_30554/m.29460 type:complete len:247 (-) Transcript_30554:230-970(-)
MIKSTNLFQVFLLIGVCTFLSCAFAPALYSQRQQQHFGVRNNVNVKRDTASVLFMKDEQLEQQVQPFELYPALSRISGIDWTGSCLYVGADLVHLSKLKLTGGVRYDIINGTTIALSSFLTFPNGNKREVKMQGSRENLSSVITLRSFEEDEEGPIYMEITELGTDTILINEVVKATGNTVMTASLSIVQGSDGATELVQVSHEVGSDSDNKDKKKRTVIEGHQVWRLTGGTVEFDDFDTSVQMTP